MFAFVKSEHSALTARRAAPYKPGMIVATNGTVRGCRPLTDAEVARVLATFSGPYAGRDRALFTLGVLTGFRISELLSLTVGDVRDLDGGVARRVTVARRNMKGRRESRTMPLHARARQALAGWLGELARLGGSDPATPLFAGRKGHHQLRPITRVHAGRVLNAAFAAAGLPHRGSHTLRKTFARNVHRADNRDLLTTQRLLGHKSVNSTVQYLESMPSEELEDLVTGLPIGAPGPLFDPEAGP